MSSATRVQQAGTGEIPAPRPRRALSRARRAALPFGSLLLFLAGWQLLAASGTWSQALVPPPAKVWDAFVPWGKARCSPN